MEIIKGNVLETNCNVIAHQVNCMGVMGAGLAKQIKQEYPEVFLKYKEFIKENGASKVYGRALGVKTSNYLFFNLFGQYGYGRSRQQTSYKHLESALEEMGDILKESYKCGGQVPVAIPYKIGCGLAGGEWEVVSQILEKVEKRKGFLFIAYQLK